MYKKVWEHSVLDKLEEGKRVFAVDTKDNILYDLKNEMAWKVIDLIILAKNEECRFFFYYWEENNEVVE